MPDDRIVDDGELLMRLLIEFDSCSKVLQDSNAFNGGSPLKSVMARLNPNVRIPVVLKWPSTV